MRRVAALATLVAALALPWQAFAAVTIRGIHASPGDGYTRVVIDLSAGTRYQYGYVPPGADKPARFYVDVHDVVLSGKEDTVVPVADPRIARVRTGQHEDTVARIVLELKGTVTPKILKLDQPPRIVVDLSGPGAVDAPLTTAGAKADSPGKATASSGDERAGTDKKAGPATNADVATAGADAGSPNKPQSSGSSSGSTSTTRVLGNVPAPDPKVPGASRDREDAPKVLGNTTSPSAPSNTKPGAAGASPSAPVPPVIAGRGTSIQPMLPGSQAATSGPPGWSQAPVPTGGSEAVASGAVSQGATAGGGPYPGQVVSATPPVVAGRGTELRALPPRPPAGAAVEPAAGGTKKARPVRVVIDPGHGGKDPGAKGPGGTEKDSVLDIAKRVAAKLRKDLGIEVHMTRSEDVYLALDERKNLANRLEADLFVSIHANASRNTKVFGIETYYLKNTNDRATLRLARLENGVDMLIKGDVSTDADLSYILSDIIQGQKEADSILLANHIQGALCGHLRKSYDSIKSLGVKQGPFLVLDGTYMPSVLVEAGFVSNSHEGGRLRASAYRESVAEGIYRGIKAYLEDDRVNDLT